MHDFGHHRGQIRMDTLQHTTFSIFVVTIIVCSYAGSVLENSLSVRVPERRLVAARGHTVILGCEFTPNFGENPDLSGLLVTWQRQEDDRVVHSFYYKEDQLKKQASAYQNRTALFLNELMKGNASVRIENVGVQDAGRYLCTVSTNQGTDKADLQLDYGAFYTEPRLTVNVDFPSIVVQYETEGFPEPELLWKGEHGTNLSNHVKTTVQLTEEMGLYSVTSSYTVQNTPLNFTFILKNQLLDQHLQRPVSLTGEQASCVKEATALAVISILFLLVAAVLVWIFCKKKKEENINCTNHVSSLNEY